MTPRRYLLVFGLCLGCATAPPAGPPPPAPSAKSAVQALLQHAEALKLTDDQYTRLLQADQRREARLADDRAQAEAAKNKVNGPPPIINPLAGSGPGKAARRRQSAREEAAWEAHADEVDAEAFYEAEQALSAAQIDQARQIASDWRDELMIWRAKMKERDGR